MSERWRVSLNRTGCHRQTGWYIPDHQTCDDNYFVDVYRFVMDIDESDLHLQTEETDGYMFATVDEIKAFAAEGKFLHYDSIKKAFELS